MSKSKLTPKLIVTVLDYLSKKFKYQEISYEDYNKILTKLNFPDFADNKIIFNFYNENVKEGINWKTLDISRLTDFALIPFVEKIKLISQNADDGEPYKLINELFPDNMGNDPIFGIERHGGKSGRIKFGRNDIEIRANDSVINDIFNMSDEELHFYYSARNGNCYEPELDRDTYEHIIRSLDSDNIEILQKFMQAMGRMDIFHQLENNNLDSESLRFLLSFLDHNIDVLDEMGSEYFSLMNSTSCQSVKQAFDEHFPVGINWYSSDNIDVDYDFLISFLENNPQVQNFNDLRSHPLIEDELYLEDSYFSFEIDYDSLNREIYRILDNAYDSFEDENHDRIEKVAEFTKLLDKIVFERGMYGYNKEISNRVDVEIPYNSIDFEKGMVDLKINDKQSGDKKYRIPFNKISEYIYTNKIRFPDIDESVTKKFKNMKIKITESQLRFLVEQTDKVRSTAPRYGDDNVQIPRMGGDISDCEKILATFSNLRGDETQYKYQSMNVNAISAALGIKTSAFKAKYPDYFNGNRFLGQDFILDCVNEVGDKIDRKIKNKIMSIFKREKPISASGLGGTKGGGSSRIGSERGQTSGGKLPCSGVNQQDCSRPDR